MSDINKFVEELEQIVSTADCLKTIVDAGSASMQKLLGNSGLFEENYLNGLLTGHSESTVYYSDKNGFIVQIFAWEGGSQTPIHDHDTWGLMGVYRNQLKVTEYGLVAKEQPGEYALNQTDSYFAGPGSVCYLIPPHEEIHQIANPTGDLTVSIHVYGKRIDEYNIYDPENDQIIHVTV